MTYGLGIDAGGTYTDTAIVELESGRLVCGNKALTTHDDLTVGIRESLSGLDPELLPQSGVLLQKWDAYLKMGCLASEMESATLFIVGGYRKVRTGTVLLTMANQTRARMGLPNPIVHDTDSAIRTAIEAVRVLIRKDSSAE